MATYCHVEWADSRVAQGCPFTANKYVLRQKHQVWAPFHGWLCTDRDFPVANEKHTNAITESRWRFRSRWQNKTNIIHQTTHTVIDYISIKVLPRQGSTSIRIEDVISTTVGHNNESFRSELTSFFGNVIPYSAFAFRVQCPVMTKDSSCTEFRISHSVVRISYTVFLLHDFVFRVLYSVVRIKQSTRPPIKSNEQTKTTIPPNNSTNVGPTYIQETSMRQHL